MDAELQAEWRALTNRAYARLREDDAPEPGYVVDARVIVLPSFTDSIAYLLCRSVRDDAAPAIARRLTWKQNDDSAKFETPTLRLRYSRPIPPTIDVASASFPASEAMPLVAALAKARVPPVPPGARLGMDGTSHELSFGPSFANSRFHWWEDAPAGWEPLETFARDLRALIDDKLGDGGEADR